jgi:hypothetical protein
LEDGSEFTGIFRCIAIKIVVEITVNLTDTAILYHAFDRVGPFPELLL